MKYFIFLLPVLLFGQAEVICIEGLKYIKFTENNNTQILPKMVYHMPAEVQTNVGWYTTTETVPGYTEQEKCEVSK